MDNNHHCITNVEDLQGKLIFCLHHRSQELRSEDQDKRSANGLKQKEKSVKQRTSLISCRLAVLTSNKCRSAIFTSSIIVIKWAYSFVMSTSVCGMPNHCRHSIKSIKSHVTDHGDAFATKPASPPNPMRVGLCIRSIPLHVPRKVIVDHHCLLVDK